MADNMNNISSNECVQESLKYQLELLKLEIEIIDQGIARLDQIMTTHKNWAIVIWTGSIALSIGHPDLRKYIFLTAIVPLLFWFLCGLWAYFQARFTFRHGKISDFLNDGRLQESFVKKQIVNFSILDPIGKQYREDDEYRKHVNYLRTFKYPSISLLFAGMIVISFLLFLFLK